MVRLGDTFELEEPINLEVKDIQFNPEFIKRIRPTATAFATVDNPGIDDPSRLNNLVVRVNGQLWKVVGVETFRIFLPYPKGMQFALFLEPMPIEEDRRYPGPRVITSGRAGGKTRRAIAWLKEGQRVFAEEAQARGYPGWSRVLVVPNRQQYDWVKSVFYREVEDFDHRVYFFEDWQRARGVDHTTEVMIDNIDIVIERLGLPGRIVGITTSSEVEQLDAVERV